MTLLQTIAAQVETLQNRGYMPNALRCDEDTYAALLVEAPDSETTGEVLGLVIEMSSEPGLQVVQSTR